MTDPYKSELVEKYEPKPIGELEKLDNFGGLLSFFNFICLFSIICSIILVPWGLMSLFNIETIGKGFLSFIDKPEGGAFSIGIILIVSITQVIPFFKIVRILKIKKSFVPKKVSGFIKALLAINIIRDFVINHWASSANLMPALESLARGILYSILWFALWTQYFRKSKRVLAYYGKNAE